MMEMRANTDIALHQTVEREKKTWEGPQGKVKKEELECLEKQKATENQQLLYSLSY